MDNLGVNLLYSAVTGVEVPDVSGFFTLALEMEDDVRDDLGHSCHVFFVLVPLAGVERLAAALKDGVEVCIFDVVSDDLVDCGFLKFLEGMRGPGEAVGGLVAHGVLVDVGMVVGWSIIDLETKKI